MIRIRRTKFIFKKNISKRGNVSFPYITDFDFFVSLVSSVRANGQTSALDSVDGGHTLYKLS